MRNNFILVIISLFVVLVLSGCVNKTTQQKNTTSNQQSNKNTVIDTNALHDFNKNYERRDEILNIDVDWDNNNGGIERFENIDVKVLETLLLEKFIDPSDRQNESPSVKEFYDFMCKYPQVLAFGYAVSPNRDDYRISIEGIYVPQNKVTTKLKEEFRELSKNADEVYYDGELYAWWD